MLKIKNKSDRVFVTTIYSAAAACFVISAIIIVLHPNFSYEVLDAFLITIGATLVLVASFWLLLNMHKNRIIEVKEKNDYL